MISLDKSLFQQEHERHQRTRRRHARTWAQGLVLIDKKKWRHVMLLSNIYNLRTMKHITTVLVLTINLMSLVGSFASRLYVVESERCSMQSFLRCNSFITTSSPPLSLLMIVSSFDRSSVKAVLSRRVIFGLIELALVYQKLHVHLESLVGFFRGEVSAWWFFPAGSEGAGFSQGFVVQCGSTCLV